MKALLLLGLIGVSLSQNPPLFTPSPESYGSFYHNALMHTPNINYLPPTSLTLNPMTSTPVNPNAMYSIAPLGPFSSDRMTGFDSAVPFLTPTPFTNYDYYPAKADARDGFLKSFGNDVSDKRYSELYRRYYSFFNTNLNRKENVVKMLPDRLDMNNDSLRREQNPESFEYDRFYDGFNENESLRARAERKINAFGVLTSNSSNSRERRLKINPGEKELDEVDMMQMKFNQLKKNFLQRIGSIETQPVKKEMRQRKLRDVDDHSTHRINDYQRQKNDNGIMKV